MLAAALSVLAHASLLSANATSLETILETMAAQAKQIEQLQEQVMHLSHGRQLHDTATLHLASEHGRILFGPMEEHDHVDVFKIYREADALSVLVGGSKRLSVKTDGTVLVTGTLSANTLVGDASGLTNVPCTCSAA